MAAFDYYYFRAIGIPTDDESLARTVDEINPKTTEIPQPDGGISHSWRDATGAGLTFFQKGDHMCWSPTFDGRSRVPVIPRKFSEYPECSYCRNLVVDVVDEDGRPFYQLALHLQDMGMVQDRVKMDVPSTAMIVAMALEHREYPSVSEFMDQRHVHEEDRFGMAGLVGPLSLFPMWLLEGNPDDYEWSFTDCVVTGKVRAAEKRVNSVTGLGFVAAEIETYGGKIDLLVPDGEFAPGAIFHGRCAMLGKIVFQP